MLMLDFGLRPVMPVQMWLWSSALAPVYLSSLDDGLRTHLRNVFT